MIFIRKQNNNIAQMMKWNKIKFSTIFEPKWTKIGQNRGISDILGTDDAI